MSRVKVIRGGRPKLPGERSEVTGRLLYRVNDDKRFGAKMKIVPADPERTHSMTRAEALAFFRASASADDLDSLRDRA